MGELEQAKDYHHERALEIRINVLGPNHIRVATSYNNLGSVFKAMGELEQAKDKRIRSKPYRVATSYNNFGSVFKAISTSTRNLDKGIRSKPYRRCCILQQLRFGVRSYG